MSIFKNVVIKFKRGLASVLSSKNIVPAAGEPIYASDTNVLKIGDGVTSYNDLPSISGGGGSIEPPENMVTTDTEQRITGTKTIARNTALTLEGQNSVYNLTGLNSVYGYGLNIYDKNQTYPVYNKIGRLGGGTIGQVDGLSIECADKSYSADKIGLRIMGSEGNSNVTPRIFLGYNKTEDCLTLEPNYGSSSNNKLYVTTDDVKYGSTISTAKSLLAGGGGTPDNMVTTDTSQKVTGSKTFENANLVMQRTNVGYNVTLQAPLNISGSIGASSRPLIIGGSRTLELGCRCIGSGVYESQVKGDDLVIDSGSQKVMLASRGDAPLYSKKASADDYSGTQTYMLHQGNVTSGDNINIENTTAGVKISTAKDINAQSLTVTNTSGNSRLVLANSSDQAEIFKPYEQDDTIDIMPSKNSAATLRITTGNVSFATNEGINFTMSSAGMPSPKAENITLGASSFNYSAPADGWVSFVKKTNGTEQVVYIQNQNNGILAGGIGSVGEPRALIPCQKGDILRISWTCSGELVKLQFNYNQGAQS